MALEIYAPESVKNADVKYVPITGVPDIDMTSLDKLASETVKIQDNKIKNIEDNYNAIMDLKDKLTGIVPDTEYNAQRLKDITLKAGIGDDFYNMSVDELRDPFVIRDKKNKLSNVMSNPEVQSIAKNAVKLQDAMNEVKRLEVKNPGMAKVAKRDLTRIKTDKEGKYDANSFDAKDYKPVDFSTLIYEELKALPKEFKIETNYDGKGYVIINKTSGVKKTMEEFAQDIVKKYGDDVNVKNTLISQVDPNKPLEEQQIEDEDAIDKFLTQESNKAFKLYSSMTVDTDVKEDKVLIDNVETRNNILEGQLKGTGKSGGKGRGSSSTKNVDYYTPANFGQFGATLAKDLIEKGYMFEDSKIVNINRIIEKEGGKYLPEESGEKASGYYDIAYIDGDGQKRRYVLGKNPDYTPVYSKANLDMKGLETFQTRMYEEEAKNPNELWGDAEKQDAFKNIKVSEMTLQEVMDFTEHGGAYSNYVKSTNIVNGKPTASTPVGKYQFVGTTLKDLVKDLRLDPNLKFDEKMQNYLAVTYAKKRFHSECPPDKTMTEEDIMLCKSEALTRVWPGFSKISVNDRRKIVKEIEGYKLMPDKKPGKTTTPATTPKGKSGTPSYLMDDAPNKNTSGRDLSKIEVETDMSVFG